MAGMADADQVGSDGPLGEANQQVYKRNIQHELELKVSRARSPVSFYKKRRNSKDFVIT